MSTVVLYCWCHSDSASVILHFTLSINMKFPSYEYCMSFCSLTIYNDNPPSIRHYTKLLQYYGLAILPNNEWFSQGILRRVWQADRGRSLLWTPGPVPFVDLNMFHLLKPILITNCRNSHLILILIIKHL